MSLRSLPVKKTPCQHCGLSFHPQGHGNHEKSCKMRLNANPGATARLATVFGDQLDRDRGVVANALLSAIGPGDQSVEPDRTAEPDLELPNEHQDEDHGDAFGNEGAGADYPGGPAEEGRVLGDDDIKVEFHPNSGIPVQIFSFDDYTSAGMEVRFEEEADDAIQVETRPPWQPFRTRLDFELSEVILDAHMNSGQTNILLGLFHEAAPSSSKFTITNGQELSEIWDFARGIHASQFKKATIAIEYNQEIMEYEVFFRPLWEWCKELLLDQPLLSQFEWHARRLSRYNLATGKFKRFYDEPFTANAWWIYETTIPLGAFAFCIILWADKTRLSSFGTQKGYPVLARCANLPIGIRNGTGVGGGRMVGWLPIPTEDPRESGKPRYVNFKRRIWHTALKEILSSIIPLTRTGYRMECGDGITRTIFPHILILSADYEEQGFMSLTRGVTSNFPCPTCLVPKHELSNLAQSFPLRRTAHMRQIYEDGQALLVTAREELLRGVGLRDVSNVFWDLHEVDVYGALSWDRLHAYHLGLFGDHILGEIKKELETLGRREIGMVDDGLRNVPPWRGLNHFHTLSNTGEFADGGKFEDLSKASDCQTVRVLLYACLPVFTPDDSPKGFQLLKILRSYIELDMFASLTVQTDDTLSSAAEELLAFGNLIEEYKAMDDGDDAKSWDFPKLHTHQHLIWDIIMKGATRNYNTKPSEKANGPLKKYYRNHTNFKDVAPQILRVNEMEVVASVIRTNIDRMDEQARIKPTIADSDDLDAEDGNADAPTATKRVFLGSIRPALSVANVETAHSATDAAFRGFRAKIGRTIAKECQLPQVRLHVDHQIIPYQFAKVHYASVIDWFWKADILRTNPLFHNRPRYDFALLQINGNQCIFVQLLYMFSTEYEGRTFQLALALPMDVPRALLHRARDEELRLTRVRPRRRNDSVIINMEKIIRGALLTTDLTVPGEHMAISTIDDDMWIRMKDIELVTHARL